VDIWIYRTLIAVIVAICLLPLAARYGVELIIQSVVGPLGKMEGAILAYIHLAAVIFSYWTVQIMQITLLVWAVTEIIRLILGSKN
jgi:hypothetical protein